MEIEELLPSWERSLRARNRAEETVTGYLKGANYYLDYAKAENLPTDAAEVTQAHVEQYMTAQVARHASATAANRYRSFQQFWRWCEEEGECDVNPMAKMSPPKIIDNPPPLIEGNHIVTLLRSCSGRRFEDRRDSALFRFFMDTGVRLGGVTGMTVHDVDLDHLIALVVLKGGREHEVPFGPKTAEAFDRYLRVRKRHTFAALDGLWLGRKGVLTGSGIEQIHTRRCRAARIPHIHPHKWRHLFAHRWLLNEGSEGDLMTIMGWATRQMVDRYGRSAANARAHEAHRRLALGDTY